MKFGKRFLLDRTGNRPHHARTRKRTCRQVFARPEREHVEASVAAAQRMGLVEVLVNDAVALTDLVRLVVHPRESGAAEHVEDLLRLAVHVRGRWLLAG